MRNPVGQIYTTKYLRVLLERAKNAIATLESGIDRYEQEGKEEVLLRELAEDRFLVFCAHLGSIVAGASPNYSRVENTILDVDENGAAVRKPKSS